MISDVRILVQITLLVNLKNNTHKDFNVFVFFAFDEYEKWKWNEKYQLNGEKRIL